MPRAASDKANPLSWLRTLLLILGLSAIGYYGYSVSDQYVYQVYQNWAFDQQIAGRTVAFSDYVRERTPLGFLLGAPAEKPAPVSVPAAPAQGALLGRVEISRLNLSAMVREGVDTKTLSLAVGHVPATALPGQAGNFAIAAHRDTLFRALKDIRKDDLVTFQSPTSRYTYQVLATEIVKPTEVSVLRPDGGGLIEPAANPKDPQKLLTMITCYPFYYVGSAPKRFIVEAKLVSSDAATKVPGGEVQNTGPPLKAKPIKQALAREPRFPRGSSLLRTPRAGQPVVAPSPPPTRPVKRRGFWHKLLHL